MATHKKQPTPPRTDFETEDIQDIFWGDFNDKGRKVYVKEQELRYIKTQSAVWGPLGGYPIKPEEGYYVLDGYSISIHIQENEKEEIIKLVTVLLKQAKKRYSFTYRLNKSQQGNISVVMNLIEPREIDYN